MPDAPRDVGCLIDRFWDTSAGRPRDLERPITPTPAIRGAA